MTEQSFGPYRLAVRLGRGGMGEVWRAVDTRKDREVAVKMLGSWLGGDPEFAARFRREAALAARLNAPNIVPIHDYGEIDGRLFIDMQLVPGTDLERLLARGPLAPGRAVALGVQVARALAVAHEAGLVHRDVKPSNVLITTTADGDDHAYLIDFGVTRALDGTRLSLSMGWVGTPAYMAPECFVGEGDARSDVYALGCVLHEALTGTPPFTAPHPFAYANLHQNVAPPRPSTQRPEVPVALDDVIARALAKSPEARYPTVTELSAAARTALAAASAPRAAPRARRRTGPADEGSAGRRAVATQTPPPVPPVALGERLTGHTASVLAVAATRFGGQPVAVSAGRDETLRIWDLSTGLPAGRRVIRRVGCVYSLAVTELDGRPVALVGGTAGQLRMWDLTTRLTVAKRLVGHTANVQGVAVTETAGQHLAVTASTDKTVQIWDLATREPVGQPLIGHGRYVFAAATARIAGRPVGLTAGADETVRLWDLRTLLPVGRPLVGHEGAVLALTAAELGERPVAVSGGIDGTVRIWDLTGGHQFGSTLRGHEGAVRAVAVTRLGGRAVAVTGGEDGTVRLWDLRSGDALGRPARGHTGWINAVAVAELGGRPVAVTGGDDHTLRVWDLTAAAAT